MLKWFLSGAIGPAGLGIYELANVVARTVSAFATLGVDEGVLLFSSRYRKSDERDRLKGTVMAAGGLILATGLLASVALWAVATFGPGTAAGQEAIARWDLWWLTDPDARRAVQWTAPAVGAWTLVLLAQGLNRAARDMRGIVVTKQLLMPSVMLVGVLVMVGLLDRGAVAAVQVMVVGTLVSGVVGLLWAGRHYAAVVRDRATKARFEVGRLLRFSIPQSLTQAAFRLNLDMDKLMLGALATSTDVGLYAIAAALAAIGAVPANAVNSIFSSFIAELVYTNDLERLDGLLKTVTRWLLIVAAPGYMCLFLLPDLFLSIYDPAFLASLTPLVILVGAQLLSTVCVPAMNTIPMAGYSLLNLANGVVALGLNVGLNWVLIPRYGSTGAAMATGITLVLWSSWRLLEVWHLLRCFPFSWRSGGLLAIAVGGPAAVHLFGQGWTLPVRAGATAGLLLAFLVAAATFGRTADDTALLQRASGKIKRMLGRGRRTGGGPPA